MKSVWKDGIKLPRFPEQNGDFKTDVLIIGGGLAGILCAYMLQQGGVDYALIESGEICGKVTGNTTAKITSQHALIYDKLIKKFGAERAKMYLDANEEAIKKYSRLCQNIDCDFETKSAYVYSLSDTEKLEKELRALDKIGFSANYCGSLPLPLPVKGAIEFKNQGQFNPLKFCAAIVSGLNIYENTKAVAFDERGIVTNKGRIKASEIIVATHFPIFNKHGAYSLKMYQHRSYVIALEGAQDLDGMYIDENEKGLSFRNYNNLMFLGGGSRRTGKKGGGWTELRDFAEDNYPNAQEKFCWATQDCMTLDSVPYIGQYSSKTPNLYVATGFNKWGMTSSMIAAEILSSMIQKKYCSYAEVFSPSRSMLTPQILVNTWEATANLLTPTTPRCPHLGCALKWNEQEQTWDCPCHGSRFEKDGTLIEDPATDDLKIKRE